MTQTNPAKQPIDFSDLYVDLLNRVREQTSSTPTLNQAKRYINVGLQDMHIGFGEKFPWCERQARLTTMAPYATGTVSITKGSQTLTGTSTVWTSTNSFGIANARATGKLIINGTAPIYEITSVGGAGTITLASPYVGDTVTGGTYVYFEDEYDLDSAFLRPLDMQFFDSSNEIRLIDRTTFRRRYANNSIRGMPAVACILDRAFVSNTTPVRRVSFFRPPDANYSIPYSFVTSKLAVTAAGVAASSLISDTDEPIVPLQYRTAIVLYALHVWYRDKKDDARQDAALKQYMDMVIRIAGDTEIGDRRPKMEAAMTNYRSRARAPYRAGGRNSRYTLGARFDQLRD